MLLQQEVVLSLVREIREKLPRLGGRKLYHLIKKDMDKNGIKIGRDGLFALLREHSLLIRQRKNKMRTTHSYRWFNRYDNLVKAITITAPKQLWVSDITYVRTQKGFKYLSMITDAYSRRIVGYHLSNDLSREGCVRALKMALQIATPTEGLIHHSDRGSQYCSQEYTRLLSKNGIRISMTQTYQPLDNPIAERINGIIKGEFLETAKLLNLEDARKKLKVAVSRYNNMRPHDSLMMATPNQWHFKNENPFQDQQQLVNL